ncbi:MAG: hypothetical protein ACKPBU_12820 [Alphaproteobacteria bacterium]
MAALLAVFLLPSGRGLERWLEAPSVPAGPSVAAPLTLTGRTAASRTRVDATARAQSSRPRTEVAREGGALAAADTAKDLQVPDELRRRPGMFLDMGVVRRLDKLKKMEAVYRSPNGEGRSG